MASVGQQGAWLRELNPAQQEAAAHAEGPLLIVAGAGTGKTQTLAARVATLINRGVDPERILLLTFTRRAAQEMLKRAADALGRSAAGMRVWGGTFHAVANRLLRMYAKPAGLDPDFTVLDQGDAEDLMDVVRHDLGFASKEKRFPRKGTCLEIYSRCLNGAEDLSNTLRTTFPWCAEWEADLNKLFRGYVDRKQEQNTLDYDDLLLYWLELLADDALADRIGGRFDHILVDEYQDTNVVQAGILQRMRRTNRNLTVVGDDAQSIYSFRSATVRNMLDFPAHFPGARVVTLDQNYRSVQPILDATNRLIAQAKERYRKDLWAARGGGERPRLVMCRDDLGQDRYVVAEILAAHERGIPLRRMAVLFRTAYHSDTLELELTRRNLPFRKYGGLKFIEAAHVKDLLAFLRLAENPRDRLAWRRVLLLIDGIGPATAERVYGRLADNGFELSSLASFPAPPAAAAGLAALIGLLSTLRAREELTPAPDIEAIRRVYEPLLDRRYDHVAARRQDLLALESAAGRYASRGEFLADLALDPPGATGDLAVPPVRDEDWLTLSTIHSAKGCEWDLVFVIHAADGCIPSDMATGTPEEIEEERRLLYVAMTRARNALHVVWPLRYYAKGRGPTDRHTYAQRSRFLSDDVRAAMDSITFDADVARMEADPAAPTVDLKNRVRSRWA